MDDSEEYDPFDFVAMYKRLKREREEQKREKALNDSKIDKKPDGNQQSSSSSSSSSKRERDEQKEALNTDSKINKKPDGNQQSSSSSSHSSNTEVSQKTVSDSSSKSYTNTQPDVVPKPIKRRRYQPPTENCTVLGPVICIGDFDDGYNMPPPLQPPKTTRIVDKELDAILARIKNNDYLKEVYDDDIDVVNRVMNVKVHWRKTRIYQFPIRMYQSIESIFEHFAKLEETNKMFVLLQLRNKTLSPSDTPKSMKYGIAEFIDGDLEYYKSPSDEPKVGEGVEDDNIEVEEEVKFCIKQKDVRHPFVMNIKKSEKMVVLYIKIAEKLGIDANSFTLVFDGEKIKHSDNMESLDLEGDECFDLFEKKNQN